MKDLELGSALVCEFNIFVSDFRLQFNQSAWCAFQLQHSPHVKKI